MGLSCHLLFSFKIAILKVCVNIVILGVQCHQILILQIVTSLETPLLSLIFMSPPNY